MERLQQHRLPSGSCKTTGTTLKPDQNCWPNTLDGDNVGRDNCRPSFQSRTIVVVVVVVVEYLPTDGAGTGPRRPMCRTMSASAGRKNWTMTTVSFPATNMRPLRRSVVVVVVVDRRNVVRPILVDCYWRKVMG